MVSLLSRMVMMVVTGDSYLLSSYEEFPFISYVFSLSEIRLENFLNTTINASDSPPLSKA